MKNITIGITSIGSGVGQSIIDSIKHANIQVRTIGYGNNPLAFGSFDCTESYLIPPIKDSDYIKKLLDYCIRDKVKILIPGLDDELYKIEKNKNYFYKHGISIIITNRRILDYCRNKDLMSQELNKINDCFVRCLSTTEARKHFEKHSTPLIAKPNSGCASRGIKIINNANELDKIEREDIIQEIATPSKTDSNYKDFMLGLKNGKLIQKSEASLQIIVSKTGKILGKFSSINNLNNGVPIEIIPKKLQKSWTSIDPIINHLIKIGHYGPLNFQGRITDNGLKIFEMNARFTGITGIRALFGFNEVSALIHDIIEPKNRKQNLKTNYNLVGIRQTQDKVINCKKNKEKKHILITGASGYLAQELIKQLLNKKNEYKITGVVRNTQKNEILNQIDTIKAEDFYEGGIIDIDTPDIICHLASARPVHSFSEIAQSAIFTDRICRYADKNKIEGLILASSHSIYGNNNIEPWHEGSHISPDTPYAFLKFMAEQSVLKIRENSPQTKTIALRFSRLIGRGSAMRNNEFIHKFIELAKNSETIIISHKDQKVDLINVRDAANSIVKVINLNTWPDTLNIGSNKIVNTAHIANLCIRTVSNSSSKIEILDDITKQQKDHLMTSQKAVDILKWTPSIPLEESINELYEWSKIK